MKLIDMLVEELPKRGGWPEGAEIAVQDTFIDNYIKFGGKGFQIPTAEKECYGDIVWRSDEWNFNSDFDFATKQPASDYATAIITREQYEAALSAKNDGWIEWGGGRCPVDDVTEVDIKFRTGGIAYGVEAGKYYWPRTGQEYDIIAYRLHQSQEAAQAKADDEADLNECIGQDAAPVWNGEGLPPVGCECEWQDKNTKQWQPVKVVYSSEWVTVIREINKEKGDDLVEIAIENYGDDARIKFRPIRSEAERKRDEAVKAITLTGWCQTAAEEIYDLIAAGKVPGVKLED